MSQEIELKLALPAGAVPRLRRHPLFAAAPQVGPRQTLVNTYFDTPGLMLKNRRVALRLRKQGRRWLQTVKCGGEFAGGLAQRPEWEYPYLGSLDFNPVDEPAVRALLEAQADKLQPVFTTTFRRETRRHAPREGVEILLMLDLGTVEAAGRSQPLCELELELVSGAVDDLYALALELAQDLPLLPEDVSKAQRGYRLFLAETLVPSKASPSDVEAGDTPVAAFRRLALAGVRQWQANANAAMSQEDPEFIHQMRVALRRLRSLLRLMAPALPPEFVEEWNCRLRDETNRLGRARDLDVLLETILAPVEAAAEPPAGLAGLRARGEAARARARKETVAALATGTHGLALLGFSAALYRLSTSALDRSVDLPTFARLQLERLRKGARRRLEEVREDASPEHLHALRIALKRLRYGLEFFQPLGARRPLRRLLRALAEAQDSLGYLHDLAEARQHLEEWAGTQSEQREAAAFVVGWHGRRAAGLKHDLPAAVGRLLRGRLPLKSPRASS